MYADRMGIAVAIEAVSNTDQVPTAALNAILAENVKLTPLDGDENERTHVRPGGSGAFRKDLVNKRVMLEFDVRLRGAGAAGGTPPIDPVLRAVGFAGFTSAGVHRQYKLVSGNSESCTIYLFRGDTTSGVRHRLIGARGGWKLSVDPKTGDIILSVSMMGLYTDPSSVAMPTNFDFSGFTSVPIPPVNKTNTTFTIGGYAAVVSKLDIDSGKTAVHRALINYEGTDNSKRAVTGSITIQEPDIAAKNFFSTAYGNPEVMVFENGLTAGQIFRLDAARVQRGKPTLGDVDGLAALTIPLIFLPSDAGDDNDIIYTFK